MVKQRIYVIADERELKRMQSLAKKYGSVFACDICGWEFRVRDIVVSRYSRSRGNRPTRRCAICYGKAFGWE